MKHYVAHESYVDVLTKIIGPNVKCMQSMLFIKASGKPGQAWHQDEYFIPTRDRSLVGGWLAMDAATVENGCLWILPGSHKRGIIYPHAGHEDRRFDCAGQSFSFRGRMRTPFPSRSRRAASFSSTATCFIARCQITPSRAIVRVLVNHYMSAESLLPWRYSDKVHMGIQDSRDILMIAGEDPYAWKGTEDWSNLYVRPQRRRRLRQRQEKGRGNESIRRDGRKLRADGRLTNGRRRDGRFLRCQGARRVRWVALIAWAVEGDPNKTPSFAGIRRTP